MMIVKFVTIIYKLALSTMATSALTTMTTAMPCEHIEIIIVIVIMITLSLYLAPFPFSLSSPSSPLGVHDDLLFDLPCVPD